MNTFFDLETLPAQDPDMLEQIALSVKPPKAMTSPATISAWMEGTGKYAGVRDEAIKQAHLKTSFDATYGHICNAAISVDGTKFSVSLGGSVAREALLLRELFTALAELCNGRPPHFIGFNIAAFDLRFLLRRAVVLGVRPPFDLIKIARGRHGNEYTDLMISWCGYKDRISQDRLCKALGLAGKEGMDGSMVYPAWLEGNHTLIDVYNRDDVQTCVRLFHRIQLGGGR